MNPPGLLQLLLCTGSLSAGIAAGWMLRQDKAGGLSGTAAGSVPLFSNAETTAGTNVPESFSMERFRAASGLPMHRMLAQVLPHADAALIRALAEQLANRPEFPPDAVWNALFARWVQLDAPAALAWARTVEGKNLAEMAVTAWAVTDLEAALAAAQVSGTNGELFSVHRVLVKTDAARAMALFEKRRAEGDPAIWIDSHFLHEIYFNWGLQNPEAAAAHLSAQDAKSDDESLWQNLASGWARKDPAGCGDWLSGLQRPFKGSALQGLMQSIPENPAGVAKIVSALPPTDEFSHLRLQLAGRWSEQDGPAALAWVKQSFPEGPQRQEAIAKVAHSVMEKNLPAAVALMDGIGWDNGEHGLAAQNRLILPGTEESAETTRATGLREENWSPKQTIYSLLERLGRVDPQQAVRCYEKTVATGNPASLGSFVPQWFAHQPEAALRWLAAQPADRVQPSDLDNLFRNTIELEPAAAREWAHRLPPGPLQQALAARSVADGILGDPATAAEAIPFTDPATRQAALGEIIRDWSHTSPESALARLLREPTPMPETCEAVMQIWSGQDATAASTWVAAQPPGPNRDAAIRGLAAILTDYDGQSDYPAALIWSLSMTDPASRLRTAESILEGPDQSGAALEEMRRTLETTPALPENERRTLLHLLKP